jgi:hypothetical protein
LLKETDDISSIKELVESISLRVSGSSQFSKFQRMYKNDRLAFVHDIMPALGKSITDYQEEILGYLDDGKSRVAVRGPHGLGKTFLASILVHHGVLTSEEDCKIPTTASAFRQLEKYLWPEIKKTAKTLAWSAIGRPPYIQNAGGNAEFHQMSIRLSDGLVEAFAVASDNYAYIEGAHARRLIYIFDEAKTIPDGMWDAAEGAFSTEGIISNSTDFTGLSECTAFAISTPGAPSGRFYDICVGKEGYEDWLTRHVTLEECIAAGRITRAWAEKRRIQWGETSSTYQNRVLGEFADTSEEGVIPLSWINLAVERWKAWDKQGKPEQIGRKTLGVDTARMGEDKTVIACREAWAVTKIHTFSKLPTTATAGNVKAYSTGRYVNIEMDGGLGAAVYDMLHEEGVHGLKPVVVGGKTLRRDKSGELKFENVRAAMWWNMRELLDPVTGEGIMLPPIPLLIGDLAAPNYEMKRDAVICLESKDSIRERIGRSTDYGDAVCIAFWGGNSGGGVVF